LLHPGARMAHDNVFTITEVRDTARALLALAGRGALGTYHVASAAVARTELAAWIRDASVLGTRMAFDEVSFVELAFAEPRPPRTWIRADKFMAEIGMCFRHPRDIVHAKVAMLDQVAAAKKRALV
jgi:dTDP-4-dehydrorhamnose reductase